MVTFAPPMSIMPMVAPGDERRVGQRAQHALEFAHGLIQCGFALSLRSARTLAGKELLSSSAFADVLADEAPADTASAVVVVPVTALYPGHHFLPKRRKGLFVIQGLRT